MYEKLANFSKRNCFLHDPRPEAQISLVFITRGTLPITKCAGLDRVPRVIILGRPFGELIKIDPYRESGAPSRCATGYSIKTGSLKRPCIYGAHRCADGIDGLFCPVLRIAIATRRMHACRRTQLASLIDFGDIGGALAPHAGLWQFPRSRIHLNS